MDIFVGVDSKNELRRMGHRCGPPRGVEPAGLRQAVGGGQDTHGAAQLNAPIGSRPDAWKHLVRTDPTVDSSSSGHLPVVARVRPTSRRARPPSSTECRSEWPRPGAA
jgi:hypothetical protein